ncbi:MAG: histidine kinase [Bacteroidota bacterium]|nr:histidine kinase [Bacteroidota bacterium]
MKQSLIILFIFHAVIALSQQNNNYIFRHIDQSDGLLHNEVLSIIQDSKGFIWIGSANGLQRFDGNRFVNYQDEILSHDKQLIEVESLYFDNKDGIWFSGNSTLDKLDLLKNTIITYSGKGMLADRSFKFHTYTDRHNLPWLLGEYAIYNYDFHSKKLKLDRIDLPSTSLKRSGNIFNDSQQKQTWVATYQGLLLFDATTRKVYDNNEPDQHPLLKLKLPNGFSKVMIDRQHNIWVTSWNHLLYKYDHDKKKIITYSLADIQARQGSIKNNSGTLLVNCIYQDKNGTLWFGTENAGLLKYNLQQDNFDYIISEDENKQGLQYNYNIFCIFQDKEENIWLGTDKGINIFNPYHQYFQSIHHKENNIPSISKNEITDFIETKRGDILAGTWGGGIAVYDSDLHFKKNITLKGNSEKNMVWSFINADDGKIWIGCQHGYLHIYDPVREKIITEHPPQFQNSTIRCMQKDLQGNIWFGLHNGKIAMWDKSSKTFFPFGDTSANLSLATAPVYNIFIDTHQNFWIGTNNGFKQFDPIKKIYTSDDWPYKNDPASVSHQKIRGIEQLNDSTLLLGTVGNGLNLFNIKTKKNYPVTNGLPSININAIKKDTRNDIWFTTDYGLYKFKNPEGKIIAYNIEPGILNSSFVSDNFLMLHNNKWLTATSTEIISFSPDSLTRQSIYPNKVTITGFKIFDSPVFIDSFLSENKTIKLGYKQNFFSIEFAALNFSNILQTKYLYRLSGIDENWVKAGTKNFANYTNLEPGNYTFSVKTEEGDSASQPSSFSIIITPPIWKTWWFETLVFLLAVLIIYIIFRQRIIAIKHESALKQKIAETEMQALRAQMNPHFIFNCINAIDNLIQTNQKDKATTYLARFAKLIRVVLDSSKNNVVPFYKEYEALNLFLQLEQFRCSNKFEYELTADEEITHGDYKVPPLLIQPFIENAIHHGLMNKQGNDKKLSVQIGIENETIRYSIIDNGVGRQKALQIKNLNKPEHISYGIEISTERVHLYNKNGNEKNVTITDLYTDGSPSGTMVQVCINVNNIN